MTFVSLPSCFELPQVEDVPIHDSQTDDSKCPMCCVELQREDTQHKICPSCGLKVNSESETVTFTYDIAHSYNCGANSHIHFKVVGCTPSARIQNSLIKRVSDYNTLKQARIRNKILKWVNQTPDDVDSIPISVVDETTHAYCELQEENKLVKRAGGLDAVLSYIIYCKCAEMHAPRKHKTIVQITGIQDNQMSAGEKTIDKLKDQTVIEHIDDSCEDYIEMYFEKLNIENNARYKGFVADLIHNSRLEKINTKDNTSIMTTRCAGSIYILCKQLSLNVTKQDIETNCNIAKGTFMRFVAMILTHQQKKCIKKVFTKYDVPIMCR